MNASLLRASVALLGLSIGVPAAWADVAPPRGFVDPCSLERMEAAGRTECEPCRQSRATPDAPTCEQIFAERALERACRTGGATVYTEIWCTPTAAGPATGSSAHTGQRPSDEEILNALAVAVEQGTAAREREAAAEQAAAAEGSAEPPAGVGAEAVAPQPPTAAAEASASPEAAALPEATGESPAEQEEETFLGCAVRGPGAPPWLLALAPALLLAFRRREA